ncbi:LuxR C-terminal-related transcriptional regulator [Kitasatospora sp. NPDC096147]|uniref:LuxR C-terminal-related transcriptional regulator n=1 Tax=Kitasatospora sp. NPDC096147 TaxID=3364093 RepID=UPI00380F8070
MSAGRPVLSDDAREVYGLLAGRPKPVPIDELRARTELPIDALDRAIGVLVRLGLLCPTALAEGMLHVMAPDSARAQRLGPIVRELNDRQFEVDSLREAYAELAVVYQRAALGATQAGAVEVIRDPATVLRVLTEYAAAATREVLGSQPGGAVPDGALAEFGRRTDELLHRGVRLRALFQHTARYGPVTVGHLEHLSRRGAEVRTRSDGFMRLLLFDGEVAVTGLVDDPGGAAIVRDPHVIAFMAAAFERAWSRATPFRPQYDPVVVEQTSDDVRTTIMHLLVEGLEDKVVARRLGMSLRSCQRHISEIMRRLGARNRLHAGYLIVHHGLLEHGTAPTAGRHGDDGGAADEAADGASVHEG